MLCLRSREIANHSSYRQNMAIIRTLVSDKSTNFKKVWEKSSKYPICYDGNYIYFDNYRTCYVAFGVGGIPRKLYSLPLYRNNEKIEDALLCQCSLEHLPVKHRGYRGSFLALTTNNWLLRYDINTAEVLQRVYLPPTYKFKHISSNSALQTIVVKSIHNRSSTYLTARHPSESHSSLMALGVFKIFPLEFTGLVEIDKAVFGNDTCDANIMQGILITMHHSGVVKLFSFERILQTSQRFEAKLGECCAEWNKLVPGSYPAGLPFNVVLNEAPAVLFNVRCSDFNVQLGGFPWHYIISPHGYHSVFKVFSLSNSRLAENGTLVYSSSGIEADKASFHPDESGRVLHSSGQKVSVLSLCSDTTPSVLQECFTIDLEMKAEKLSSMTTSSGRNVRRSVSFEDTTDCHYQCIQGINYENEMEILYVTYAQQSHTQGHMCGHVLFYNNQTGNLEKNVPLEGMWDEDSDHNIELDIDTIVHITKSPVRRFTCSLYRMHRGLLEKEPPVQRRNRASSKVQLVISR